MTNDTSMTEAEEARFWSKVDRSNGPDACWPWLAARSDGYGELKLHGRVLPAHRVAYELVVGPIPDGLHIDHGCHTPPCVNPSHLRPATPGQNAANRRGAAQNSKTGIRGVRPVRDGWGVVVKPNGRVVYDHVFDHIWDADLTALLVRASIFGPNAADRWILENADLLWGSDYVPAPPRPPSQFRRKGQKAS